MFMPNSPVDELAGIRAKISELRARETALVAQFVQLQNTGPFVGFAGDVVVDETTHEVFDISKLPAAILNDARFYSMRKVTTVTIEPHEDINRHSSFAGFASKSAHAVEIH